MPALASALSSALLHFLWQGVAIAALLSIVLVILRRRSPNVRYLAACFALAAMAASPIVTLWWLDRPAPSSDRAAPTASVFATGAALPTALAPIASDWVLPLWFAGVMLFSLRLAWSGGYLRALRRSGQPAAPDLAATVDRLAQRLGIKRSVSVLITQVTDSPSAIGWLRPAILLPTASLLGLSTEQLDAVLAHELAHIRRHDYLVNLAQMLIETVLFYHPAVWWVSARIRHERELCCDDAAVACCGSAAVYARALTQLEKMRAPAMAMASTGGSLLYRIRRLAGVATQERVSSRWPALVAVSLSLVGIAATVNWTHAEPLPPQAAAPPAITQVAYQVPPETAPVPDATLRFLGEQLQEAERRLADLRRQYTDQHPDIQRAQEVLYESRARYARASLAYSLETAKRDQATRSAPTAAEVVRSSQLVRFETERFLRDQVGLAEQELAALRTQYNAEHPSVRRSLERLADLKVKYAAATVQQAEEGTTAVSPDTFDPGSYVIGVGDILQVVVWREPSFSGRHPVRSDGMITIPLMGEVPAAGLTPSSLAAAIKSGLARYIQNPDVIVGVLSTRSQP